jgi:hypothetical protein
MMYRIFKRHLSAGTSGAQPLETFLGHPGAPAGGGCSLAVMAAPPASGGGLPWQLVARRSGAMRDLDMQIRLDRVSGRLVGGSLEGAAKSRQRLGF